MDLMSYLRILRRRWVTVFVVASLGVIVAGAVTASTPRSYESSVEFFVSASGTNDVTDLARGGTFTEKRVKSYTEVVHTPLLLLKVIDETGLDLTPKQLEKQIEATAPTDTVILTVTVTDGNPERAQRIAAAISVTLPQTVADLEKLADDEPSPVKLTLMGPATADDAPVAPRPVRNLVLGLVAGLLLGFLGAMLRHALDRRVRTREDVEEITDGIVLGGIPYDGDAGKHPLIETDRASVRAEAFRSLRTNLQFIDAARHPRVMVVTSSVAGEGKSTTAANLALSMAEAGKRVCVVEADLRRPKVLSYLGLEGSVGLTDVLIDRVLLEDALQPFGSGSLEVLGAGASPPNPSELLGSEGMVEVLRFLASRYDHVIIDGPPLLPVTDSAVLSRLADGAMVVVGSGIVARDQLGAALQTLATANASLLGVVLNRVPRDARGSHYGDYYDHRPGPTRTTSPEGGDSGRHPRPEGSRPLGSSKQTRPAVRAEVPTASPD